MSLLAECLDQEHIGNYDIDGDGSILLRSDGSSFNNHKNKDYEDLEEESSGDDDDDEDDDESSTNKKKEIISDGKDLEALNKIKSSDLLKCLEKSYMSSKIEKSLSIINELLNDFPKDKLIIVSQWTSMLGIIARQLKKQSIEYCEIKGEVSLAKRNEIVESFNDKSNTEQQVMLLSLCAGGVGLVINIYFSYV
jgi:transcription termination factor 2